MFPHLRILSTALEEPGFLAAQAYSPVEFLAAIDPEFDDHSLAFLPHFDRSGLQVSLGLEAEKK